MATFQTSGRSLYDMVKNLDANGNAVKTAEVLQKACPMLQDAPIVTANNITTHKVSVRTGLPAAEVKRLNQGVGGSFGSRETYEFGMKEYQASCGELVTKTIPIYSTINVTEKAKRTEPLYGDVCYKSTKSRKLISKGSTQDSSNCFTRSIVESKVMLSIS